MANTRTYYGLTRPVNDVIMGQPVPPEYLKAENTTVKPGLLVKKGTNPDDIEVCDASGNPGGWAGYGAAAVYKPDNTTTAYAADDMVPVHSGSGFHVLATLATGQSVAKNAPLKPADNGEVQAGVPGTDHIVAYAEEDASGNVQFLAKSAI
ncbi:MAG: hypothetical protein Q8J68_08915 [Methanolobus sp.]|uniref:hypothetical protein n=1 Tax=Methanolobus sp. TaxID=1874737 RepID=UPI00272FE60B|nr:hypothetical protein [Methanolobus sp.]MDP2217393.1 hypothetical protein [Methanolobus sp.]